MATIFRDIVGAKHITIPTPADWTTQYGSLPNGDNAHSLSTTLTNNGKWAGEDFCLPATAGSDARTLECWVKVTAAANDRCIAYVRTDSTSTAASQRHWGAYLLSNETIDFAWWSTTGIYLEATSGVLSAGWRHIVAVFECGSTRSITIYVDGSANGADTTPSGTPTTAASAAYEFYLGASRTVATEEMTDHMAKVAWYNRALTGTEITDHYNEMI